MQVLASLAPSLISSGPQGGDRTFLQSPAWPLLSPSLISVPRGPPDTTTSRCPGRASQGEISILYGVHSDRGQKSAPCDCSCLSLGDCRGQDSLCPGRPLHLLPRSPASCFCPTASGGSQEGPTGTSEARTRLTQSRQGLEAEGVGGEEEPPWRGGRGSPHKQSLPHQPCLPGLADPKDRPCCALSTLLGAPRGHPGARQGALTPGAWGPLRAMRPHSPRTPADRAWVPRGSASPETDSPRPSQEHGLSLPREEARAWGHHRH